MEEASSGMASSSKIDTNSTSIDSASTSAFLSREKKPNPARKHQRHSTEIGCEYHRWWTVRSHLGFQTNEQIAGILLDGFYVLLESIATSGGANAFDSSSNSEVYHAHDKHNRISSSMFLSSSSSSPPPSPQNPISNLTYLPESGFATYSGGIEHYTEAIWRMYGHREQWLERGPNPALQSFLSRLLGFLKTSKGRGFSLNYRKKKFPGKSIPLSLPTSHHPTNDIRLFSGLSPNAMCLENTFRPPENWLKSFSNSDTSSISTNIHPSMPLTESATVQVNLTEPLGKQCSLDEMLPPVRAHVTSASGDFHITSVNSDTDHTPKHVTSEATSSLSLKKRRKLDILHLDQQEVASCFDKLSESTDHSSPSELCHKTERNDKHAVTVPDLLNQGFGPVGPQENQPTSQDVEADGASCLHHNQNRGQENAKTTIGHLHVASSFLPQIPTSTTVVTISSEPSKLNSCHIFGSCSETLPGFPEDSVAHPTTQTQIYTTRRPVKNQIQNFNFLDKSKSQTSTICPSLVLYPAHGLQPQDNSLASLSSLVQNIVYNSQGSILKPLASCQSEKSSSLVNDQGTMPALIAPEIPTIAKGQSQQARGTHSQIRFMATSLSSSAKPTVVPLFLAPPLNITNRLPSNHSNIVVPTSLKSASLLAPTTLSVRQSNSMTLNFSVYKMSQEPISPSFSADAHRMTSNATIVSPSVAGLQIKDVRSNRGDKIPDLGDATNQTLKDNPYDLTVPNSSSGNGNSIFAQASNQRKNESNNSRVVEINSIKHTAVESASTDHSGSTKDCRSPNVPSKNVSQLRACQILKENDTKMRMLPSLLMSEPVSSSMSQADNNEMIKVTGAGSKMNNCNPSSLVYSLGRTTTKLASVPMVTIQEATCHKAPVLSTKSRENAETLVQILTKDVNEVPSHPQPERSSPSTKDSRDSQKSPKRNMQNDSKMNKTSSNTDKRDVQEPVKKSSSRSSRNSTCYDCSWVFCSATDLLVHRYEMHSFICGECDGRFLTESKLQQHKLADHPQIKKCSSCRFTTFSDGALTKHMWCEHGIKTDDVTKRKNSREGVDSDGSSSVSLTDQTRHREKIMNGPTRSQADIERHYKSPEDEENIKDHHTTGPVFPSFKKKASETTPSNLRSIVDMYKQVNQHCQLDSTDFLTHITDTKGSRKDNADFQMLHSSSVGPTSDPNMGVDGRAMKQSGATPKDEKGYGEPLCLVVHQRNHRQDKERLLDRDMGGANSTIKRGVTKEVIPKGGKNGLLFEARSKMVREMGDCNETQSDRKLYLRNIGGRRKRKATLKSQLLHSADGAHHMKGKKRDKRYVRNRTGNPSQNKTLSINVDKNHMLSLKTSRHRYGEKVRQRRREGAKFSNERPSIMDEPSLEIDYAEEDDTQMKLGYRGDYDTKPSIKSYDGQSNNPSSKRNELSNRYSSCDTINSTHCALKIKSRQPMFIGTDEPRQLRGNMVLKLKKKEEANFSRRNASVRDIVRHGSRHLSSRKRSIRRSTRTVTRSSRSGHRDLETQKYVITVANKHAEINVDEHCQKQHGCHGGSRSQKQRYQCPYEGCPSTFSRKWSMDCHIRKIHNGKFICEITGCQRVFDSKTDLRQHVNLSHNGRSRQWKCGWTGCTKVFFSHAHLRVHLLTHTGEKPMACDKCDYRCRQRTALVWHKKKHHQEQPQLKTRYPVSHQLDRDEERAHSFL